MEIGRRFFNSGARSENFSALRAGLHPNLHAHSPAFGQPASSDPAPDMAGCHAWSHTTPRIHNVDNCEKVGGSVCGRGRAQPGWQSTCQPGRALLAAVQCSKFLKFDGNSGEIHSAV